MRAARAALPVAGLPALRLGAAPAAAAVAATAVATTPVTATAVATAAEAAAAVATAAVATAVAATATASVPAAVAAVPAMPAAVVGTTAIAGALLRPLDRTVKRPRPRPARIGPDGGWNPQLSYVPCATPPPLLEVTPSALLAPAAGTVAPFLRAGARRRVVAPVPGRAAAPEGGKRGRDQLAAQRGAELDRTPHSHKDTASAAPLPGRSGRAGNGTREGGQQRYLGHHQGGPSTAPPLPAKTPAYPRAATRRRKPASQPKPKRGCRSQSGRGAKSPGRRPAPRRSQPTTNSASFTPMPTGRPQRRSPALPPQPWKPLRARSAGRGPGSSAGYLTRHVGPRANISSHPHTQEPRGSSAKGASRPLSPQRLSAHPSPPAASRLHLDLDRERDREPPLRGEFRGEPPGERDRPAGSGEAGMVSRRTASQIRRDGARGAPGEHITQRNAQSGIENPPDAASTSVPDVRSRHL